MAAIAETRRSAAPRHEGEGAARATLRAQIGRLERELAALAVSTYPWPDVGAPARFARDSSGPRLLTLGDLEALRDSLAVRLAALRAASAAQAERQERARDELERMRADPPAHRWRRITNAELGRPGCTTYHVRPQAGLLGLLMGWWQVKVSGGCPLGP